MRGEYVAELYNPDGVLSGVYRGHNNIPIQGANYLLGRMFHADAEVFSGTRFMGLINAGTGVVFADTDTHASHPGWTEFTSYTGSARITITAGAASGRSILLTTATFTFTGAGTLRGFFVTTNQTRGSIASTHKLLAIASLADIAVVANATLIIKHTISA